VTNACLGYLRRVFEIGIEKGYIMNDPSKGLVRKVANATELDLPNAEQFKAIVAHVRSRPGPCPDDTADLIEGLAYSGMRLGEAKALKWKNVKLDTGVIKIRRDGDFDEALQSSTDPKKDLKTPSSRRDIPINESMRDLLSRLPKSGPKVFRCRGALGSLASACKTLGLTKLTHHDLRHYFATTCVQQGVDVPTLSYWLGHSDGGALAMKTYLHYNAEHGARVAAKVVF
jgi:integrase